MATTDEARLEDRIQKAAELLGVSVAQLKEEIKQALIKQVANELAAESLREWKATEAPQSRPTVSNQFPSIEGKAEDEDAPLPSPK